MKFGKILFLFLWLACATIANVQNHGGNLIHIDHSVEQERNIPVGVPNGKHIVCGSIVPHQVFRTVLEADLGYGNVSVGIVLHLGGVHANGNGGNLDFAICQQEGIDCQRFVNHSDEPGGSKIGRASCRERV